MTQRLRAVEVADLEEYPEALADPAAANDYFTKFWHNRWLSSRMRLMASMAVQGAALNLFWLARSQVPVGSLPVDQRMLARMLMISDGEWHGLMAEDVTPLHNWREYRHGADIVLGHPVVIEVSLDALGRREERKLANDDKAVRERRRRLQGTMKQINCADSVIGDWPLVCWLDEWLEANHHGQRRFPQIEHSLSRALAAAHAAGKLNRGR